MSIAIIEEKNDEIIPIIMGRTSNGEVFRYSVNNSTSPDIEIAGIPIRKDILAAVCLWIPENNAEVNVIPDLETPGNIAKDCDTPIKIISLRLMLENNFFLSP